MQLQAQMIADARETPPGYFNSIAHAVERCLTALLTCSVVNCEEIQDSCDLPFRPARAWVRVLYVTQNQPNGDSPATVNNQPGRDSYARVIIAGFKPYKSVLVAVYYQEPGEEGLGINFYTFAITYVLSKTLSDVNEKIASFLEDLGGAVSSTEARLFATLDKKLEEEEGTATMLNSN